MKTISMLLIMAALVQAALAAPITITNSSFESNPTLTDANANGNTPDWNFFRATNTYLINNSSGINVAGTTGSQFLFFEPYADLTPIAWQNTGATYGPGTYTITVDVGYATGYADAGANASANFQLLAYDGAGGYTYNLAGGTPTIVSAATLQSHDGALATYTYTLNVANNAAYLGQTVTVLVGAESLLFSTQAGQNVSYDNVRLDYMPVPEPATGLLVLLGLAGVLKRRR